MNIEPITMDPRIANIHYKDYRKKVIEQKKARIAAAQTLIAEGGKTFRRGRQQRSQIEKEDEVLMHSYKALSKGQRILNVADVVRNGGLDARRLPKLAIGGADWKFCHIHRDHNMIVFGEDYWLNWKYSNNQYKQDKGHRCIHFLDLGFPAELTNGDWRRTNNHPPLNGQTRAIVPSIPIHLRPAGDLSMFQILWEAEWKTEAPKDPLLLRHIAGNMYSVLAQWDLTELERDVLEGRIS